MNPNAPPFYPEDSLSGVRVAIPSSRDGGSAVPPTTTSRACTKAWSLGDVLHPSRIRRIKRSFRRACKRALQDGQTVYIQRPMFLGCRCPFQATWYIEARTTPNCFSTTPKSAVHEWLCLEDPFLERLAQFGLPRVDKLVQWISCWSKNQVGSWTVNGPPMFGIAFIPKRPPPASWLWYARPCFVPHFLLTQSWSLDGWFIFGSCWKGSMTSIPSTRRLGVLPDQHMPFFTIGRTCGRNWVRMFNTPPIVTCCWLLEILTVHSRFILHT